jgi:hypothetical protein
MSDARWRKSSYSGSEANCVEVAGQDERVLVRDTKDRAGAVLRFSPAAWRRFAEQAKRSLGHPGRCVTLAPGNSPEVTTSITGAGAVTPG